MNFPSQKVRKEKRNSMYKDMEAMKTEYVQVGGERTQQ